MNTTEHLKHRMSQRGITNDMIRLVLDLGTPEQDKIILGRKEALAKLKELQQDERVLKKVIDKGGLVVVAADGAMITAYNCTSRRH